MWFKWTQAADVSSSISLSLSLACSRPDGKAYLDRPTSPNERKADQLACFLHPLFKRLIPFGANGFRILLANDCNWSWQAGEIRVEKGLAKRSLVLMGSVQRAQSGYVWFAILDSVLLFLDCKLVLALFTDLIYLYLDPKLVNQEKIHENDQHKLAFWNIDSLGEIWL